MHPKENQPNGEQRETFQDEIGNVFGKNFGGGGWYRDCVLHQGIDRPADWLEDGRDGGLDESAPPLKIDQHISGNGVHADNLEREKDAPPLQNIAEIIKEGEPEKRPPAAPQDEGRCPYFFNDGADSGKFHQPTEEQHDDADTDKGE